jgi:FHA domain
MTADPNKKSARTFQCREVLWDTFEQMARELECSVDYLVNEAMKQYARQRSYGGARTPHPGFGRSNDSQPQSAERGDSGYATTLAPPGSVPQPVAGGALPAPGRLPPPPGRSVPMPVPPPRGALPVPPPARPATAPGSRGVTAGAPASVRSMPPPLPRPGMPPPLGGASSNGFPATGVDGGPLTLVYLGERHAVTKDRFVIGRGKQSSDLTLRDPNVSRQHAMIEFQNGLYFMVDMGSTNGVEHNGQRIARKQIAEGDVFRICDHDIQFTYR